ncbi:MAG TPA: DMT family transporter [Hyphomicrobiaceae bacterium]|nr:DMT family transporter [Hyphomicrobiaceae bacterium]
MRRLHADMILLAIAAIWGLAFVFQKTAMDHIGPFLFLASRSIIAALALGLLALRENRRIETRAPPGFWLISCAGGATFFLGGILQQIGLVTATVTNTGFLTGLYVVITPLLMWLVLGKPPMFYVWPAVALAFAGTWLLGGGTVSGFSRGDWLVAISALFWSAHMLVVANSGQYARPIGFTAAQFTVVAALSLVGVGLFETVSLASLLAAAPQIAYVGLLSSALTFTLLAVAMRHTPAAEATILVSTETVFAALCAALLLGEALPAIGWVGAAMMFGATLIVQAAPALLKRRTGDH